MPGPDGGGSCAPPVGISGAATKDRSEAMTATLRVLRRKVDQSLVTMTDRGRVQQDVILGVLCGAIIGLFF